MIYLRYRVHDFGDDPNELGHKLRNLPASRLMEWSVAVGSATVVASHAASEHVSRSVCAAVL